MFWIKFSHFILYVSFLYLGWNPSLSTACDYNLSDTAFDGLNRDRYVIYYLNEIDMIKKAV